MTTERIELRTFGRGGIHPDTHKRDTALLRAIRERASYQDVSLSAYVRMVLSEHVDNTVPTRFKTTLEKQP